MHIWIVQIAEPIQGTDGNVRAGRCNLLAAALVHEGHQVTWWTSSFDHFRKIHRDISGNRVVIESGASVRLLKTRWGYRRNVSLARVLNQRAVARRFSREARRERSPDLVFCCLPVPEVCGAAAEYCATQQVPYIVDVRDPWPDVYLQTIPKCLRPIGKLLLCFEYRRLRRILDRAKAVTAVSDTYLSWALQHRSRLSEMVSRVFPLGFQKPRIPAVNLVVAQDNLTRRFDLTPGAVRVVFSGVFGRFYDLNTLLEAARQIGTLKGTGIQFIFAGSGDKEADLRQRATGLPNVLFTGWLKQDELYPLLRSCDIAVSAYTKDALQSLPNKPFDYMAAGLPQISSLPGELEEIISRCNVGLHYEAGNVASLVQAILRLAESPDQRVQLGRRAEALFDTQYDADAIYPVMAHFLTTLARHTG